MLVAVLILTLTSEEKLSDAIKTILLWAVVAVVLRFTFVDNWITAAVFSTPSIIMSKENREAERYWLETHPEEKKQTEKTEDNN